MPPFSTNISDRRAVIFDLDGTLVDSSPGILYSLTHAFGSHGISPLFPLEPSLIGPPLGEIINELTTDIDSGKREALINSFKSNYDCIGYASTIAFEGVSSLLTALAERGVLLAIATNKRSVPTLSILRKLSWLHYFSKVYSPDSVHPASPSKTHLIKLLLDETGWHPGDCLYIGDRIEDWQAASANGLRFGWAQWGFGKEDPQFDDDSFVLFKPDPTIILNQLYAGAP